jgi:hypothetical protein
MSTIREQSNLALTVLIERLAPEYHVNADNVSVVINGEFTGVHVNRYTQENVEKFLIILGKEFISTMERMDAQSIFHTLKQALGMLKQSQTIRVTTPVVAIAESDFTYEYVVRAKHRTGLILSRTSNRPDILAMKQAIHEETANIVGFLVQEKGK